MVRSAPARSGSADHWLSSEIGSLNRGSETCGNGTGNPRSEHGEGTEDGRVSTGDSIPERRRLNRAHLGLCRYATILRERNRTSR